MENQSASNLELKREQENGKAETAEELKVQTPTTEQSNNQKPTSVQSIPQLKPSQQRPVKPEEDLLMKQFKQLVPSIKSLTSQCEFGLGNLGIIPETQERFHYERPSLIPIFTKAKPLGIGPATTYIIDPPSDGKFHFLQNSLGGDSEEELQQNNPVSNPFFQTFQGKFLLSRKLLPLWLSLLILPLLQRYSNLIIQKTLDDIPENEQPKIMITNIEPSMIARQFKEFLDSLLSKQGQVYLFQIYHIFSPVAPQSINLMGYNGSKAAVVTYEKKEDAQTVFTLLKENESRLYSTRVEKFHATFVYDNRKLASENWIAVVLRNLPSNCQADLIKTNFEKNSKIKILAVESLRQVNSQLCAIVRVKSIEDAEYLCRTWNYFFFNEYKQMKCHIHPYSNFLGRDFSSSNHIIFKKQSDHFKGFVTNEPQIQNENKGLQYLMTHFSDHQQKNLQPQQKQQNPNAPQLQQINNGNNQKQQLQNISPKPTESNPFSKLMEVPRKTQEANLEQISDEYQKYKQSVKNNEEVKKEQKKTDQKETVVEEKQITKAPQQHNDLMALIQVNQSNKPSNPIQQSHQEKQLSEQGSFGLQDIMKPKVPSKQKQQKAHHRSSKDKILTQPKVQQPPQQQSIQIQEYPQKEEQKLGDVIQDSGSEPILKKRGRKSSSEIQSASTVKRQKVASRKSNKTIGDSTPPSSTSMSPSKSGVSVQETEGNQQEDPEVDDEYNYPANNTVGDNQDEKEEGEEQQQVSKKRPGRPPKKNKA